MTGLFKRRERESNHHLDDMEQIVAEGLDRALRDLADTLGEHGAHVDIGKSAGGSFEDKIDVARTALDKGIRDLQLKEDISFGPEKASISRGIKHLKTVRGQLISLAEIVVKLRNLRDRKR